MFVRIATLAAAGLLIGMLMPPPVTTLADGAKPVAANGLVKVKSAYGMDETVARLKADIANKGITFSRRSIRTSSPPPPTSRSAPRCC
jgi:hypothetical protein